MALTDGLRLQVNTVILGVEALVSLEMRLDAGEGPDFIAAELVKLATGQTVPGIELLEPEPEPEPVAATEPHPHQPGVEQVGGGQVEKPDKTPRPA